jgi:hypothetical protein
MFRLIFLLGFFAFTGCNTDTPLKRSISTFEVKNDDQLGCLELTNNYCRSLYDSSSLGNLEVIRPKGNITILQGETPNDFSQVFYHYSKAKLSRKKALPPFLLKILEDLSYFDKLKSLLDRPSRRMMTYQERIQYDRLSAEVDRLWNTALDEALLRRLIAKYPGFHRISSKEMPPEYEIEYQKEKRKLLNQVSLALWKEDDNWSKVEETFERLKEAYQVVISRLDIDEDSRADFRERIQTVRLLLPGSIPEIADYQCSSTTVNAYYYKYLNIITVCAGDFNSEDILQTLAHEMGHALDIARSTYLFKTRSELAMSQRSLRKQVCEKKVIDCDQWQQFKAELPKRLEQLTTFEPELENFNQCLKRRVTTKTAHNEDFERIAKNMTTSLYSNLAGADYFLRIIKKRLPLRNGKLVTNPYYMDPCKYYLWTREEEPPEDEINSLVYFTAEYSCQKSNPSEAFKNAIDISKVMTEQTLTATMKGEGQFSDNDFMIKEGFSSPPVERYADVLGSHAIAEYLKVTPAPADRRGKILASVSWLCSEPSLKSHFPEESKIENDYSNDSHTDGLLRFQEILAAPLRESLQCKKDFEFKECSLPLKKRK